MVDYREPLVADAAKSVVLKLRQLGLESDKDLRAFVSLFTGTRSVNRGEDIVPLGKTQNILTVVLSGVACRYRNLESGRRQIFTFHYAGDFCNYRRYTLAQLDDPVGAVTDCLVGVIPHEDVDRIVAERPQVGLAFERTTALEARIFQERVLNGAQRPALERIASLICEQVCRLESVGIAGDLIPLTQIDLADAAGLSVVHVNRTIQDLRELGALTRNSHSIRVMDKARLMHIAKFDASYLAIR
jgi:CRP-like cAMP-binding protein